MLHTFAMNGVQAPVKCAQIHRSLILWLNEHDYDPSLFTQKVEVLCPLGTAVLQIGTALPFTRYLTLCDGGLYTCVATSPEGGVLTRNISLHNGC